MPAIATTADGAYIYMALQDDDGFQVIVSAGRPASADDAMSFAAVYAPGAGTAGNVATVPSDADKMLFYGYFGSGIQVLMHTVSTGAEVNISPAGLTTKVVNSLQVNPSNADEILITVDTNQDLLLTVDGGTIWTTLNAALSTNPTAMKTFWSGDYGPGMAYIAGNTGAAELLLWTPNDGSEVADIAGATLGAVTNIIGVEGVQTL